MIKILNVISDTNIGGAGKCIIYFAQNYDSNQFEISVVLPTGSALIPELQKTKVKLIEIDGLKDKSIDMKSFPKLIKIIKSEKPDIVHTHASITARIAAKLLRKKIVYTKHCAYPLKENEKNPIKLFFYKVINEFLADKIIAVGDATKVNLLQRGISESKIVSIFNGVNQLPETTQEEQLQLRKKHGILPEESVVGIVARIEKLKGYDTFVETAKILLKEKKAKAKFLILGTGSYEEEIKEKVKKLKLEKDIIFTGFTNKVGEYLNIMDVQLNCSNETETSSLSLLEGMSLGVPAVVTNCSGNPYLIQDGENGFLVPVNDAKMAAEKVYEIITNKDLRENMKQKAKKKYEEKYTVKAYTENIQKVYEEVHETPKKRHFNLLDIVILLIALIIGFIGYRILNRNQATIIENTEKVVYQIRTSETIPEVYDMISEDTSLYNSEKNYYMGKITKKEKEPSVRLGTDMTSGKTVENEIDDLVDIILTVEADAKKVDNNYMMGELDIKVGNQVNVKGKGYAASGYIVKVER